MQIKIPDALISCNWSSGSCGSLIRGKFNLKINRSVKTPLHEHSRVVGSGSWVPAVIQNYLINVLNLENYQCSS